MDDDDHGEEDRQRSTRRPAVLAWMRLARAYQKIDRSSAELFRRWELSVAQFDVLAQLRADEGISQQQLADKLLVTKGNVSQLLAKLERRGFLRREQDGRAYRLFLTSAGRAIADAAVPQQEDAVATKFAVLAESEQQELLLLLRKLDQSLS
ncbi:MAG: MarR family winged helix-turn-helix transcriptional regulator [Thermomicrobiales bacterium]